MSRLRPPQDGAWETDPASGLARLRWTGGTGPDRHLYFTGPSVSADDRWLVFLSERSGEPDLWAIDRCGGRLCRLGDNRRGLRLDYCHPWGGPQGLSTSSACLDARRNRAFAVCDDHVHRYDLDVGSRCDLGPLPAGWICNFGHVAPDGTLVLPVTVASAFVDPAASQAEQMTAVGARVANGGVRSRILCIDPETGTQRTWYEEGVWISHVAVDPAGSGRAIFNREGHWQRSEARPRIWCLDGDGWARPLYEQAVDEICSHENWTPDGGAVVYHGMRNGECWIARRSWDGRFVDRLPVPEHFDLHHAVPHPDGRGYLGDCGDGLIRRFDGEGAQVLGRHDLEDWSRQDDHPHPLTNPDGRGVLFTGHARGRATVYELRLDGA